MVYIVDNPRPSPGWEISSIWQQRFNCHVWFIAEMISWMGWNINDVCKCWIRRVEMIFLSYFVHIFSRKQQDLANAQLCFTENPVSIYAMKCSQIAKFMGPTRGPTWVLSAPDGPHVGPMNLAIRVMIHFRRELAANHSFNSQFHGPYHFKVT